MASTRVPNPWWQGGNDDDLKRNPYAQDQDDDIVSTDSSLFIEGDSEEEPLSRFGRRKSALEAELPDRSSRERYSRLLLPEQPRPPATERRSSDLRMEPVHVPKPRSGSRLKPIDLRKPSSGRFESEPTIDVSKPSSGTRMKPIDVDVHKPTLGRMEPVRLPKRASTGRSGNERERVSSSYPAKSRKSGLSSPADRPRTAGRSSSRPPVRDEKRRSSRNEKQPTGGREAGNRRGRSSGSKLPARSRSASAAKTDGRKIPKPQNVSRKSSTGENTISTTSSGSSSNNNSSSGQAPYSMAELIKHLGVDDSSNVNLPPSLERRVQDFRFAQNKRREKYGDQKPWGIYGLYAHLSDIRADLEWAEDAAWRRHRGQPYLSWRDFDNTRDKGLHSRPIFTYSVMVLCTIMLFVTIGMNGGFEPLTVNPLIGPSSETLLKCGARDTNLIVNENQWFRLFTPMVLHAGLVHFFVNMLALYFIGGAVEKAHGWGSASVFFIIPAVGGNIISAICLPGFISVGASGGIFGLIGGCMADICLNWNLLFLKTTPDDDARKRHFYILLWLAMDIFVNCLLGFTPFVDNFTHLGGFLYGFCIGFASIERLASSFFGIRATETAGSRWSRLAGLCLRFFGLIVSVLAIMVTTIVLVHSDGFTSPCHSCRYISCVPFPPNSDDKWWHCDDCDVVTADIYKSIDGTGLYEQVDIRCPNGDVEEISIDFMRIYDQEELRGLLPPLCREHCDEVFGRR